MQEGASLVWRNAFYLDNLNGNDLPRHLISMEEIQISMQEGSGRQWKAVTRSKMTLYDYFQSFPN